MTTSVNSLKLDCKKHKILGYVFTIIRSFFIVVLVAAFLFGAFRSIKMNSLHGFIDGLFFGLLLAIVSVPLIVIIDIFQRFKNYRKFKSINFRVNQKRRLIIVGEYESVFNKLCDILDLCQELSIYKKDLIKGVIEANVKSTWRSFGEKLKIIFMKGSGGKLFVEITSKPKIFITWIDYCKNFENVESILDKVKSNFDVSS